MSAFKKFEIPCYFNGAKKNVTVFIGNPSSDHHPLHFQAEWLSKERSGQIPPNIMDAIEQIYALSKKNNVPFAELWQYALESASPPKISSEQQPAVNEAQATKTAAKN